LLPQSAPFFAARIWLRDSRIDAAAIAAHFGSVSVVTFIAAQQFTERSGQPADAVLVALLVALEIPAILIGLALAKGAQGIRWAQVREVLTGKTAVLLIGGMAIGALSGSAGIKHIDTMYFQLFQGTLMLCCLCWTWAVWRQHSSKAAGARRFGSPALPLCCP